MIHLTYAHNLSLEDQRALCKRLLSSPEVAAHISRRESSPNGLAHRFNGPHIEAGLFRIKASSVELKIALSGLAKFAEGRIRKELDDRIRALLRAAALQDASARAGGGHA